MTEEYAFERLNLLTDRSQDTLTISCDLELAAFGLAHEPICMGISAVLKTVDNSLSFWALAHTDTKPDFHKREAFKISPQ